MKSIKFSNKLIFVIAIMFVSVIVALLTIYSANAEEQTINDETFTISGTVLNHDGKPKPMENALASGSFFDENGVAYITQDVRTDEDGKFTISGVLKNSYGAITFYPAPDDTEHSGAKYYIDNPVTESLDIGIITFTNLTRNISGKVTDKQGNGIANARVEFYCPSSIKSPSPDAVAITKQDGTFDWDDFIKDTEQYFNGVTVGEFYNVEVTTDNCDKTYRSQMKTVSIWGLGTTVNFTLDRIVNVKLYDYDQTENGWTEWFHQVYINGILQEDGGYLGDSNLQIPMNSKLLFKDNCRMELSYSLTTNENGVDNYVETFTPSFRIAESWEPKEFDKTVKYTCWLLWLNAKTDQDMGTTYFEGDSFMVDDNTSRIFLDVGFNERPVNPASDVTQAAQTWDVNDSLIINFSVVLALSIIWLISYFVTNNVKKRKLN